VKHIHLMHILDMLAHKINVLRAPTGLLQAAQQPDNYGLVTFTFGSKLHGQWGPNGVNYSQITTDRASMAFFWALECSSWFSGIFGAEVDDAQDGSWRHCFTWLLSFPTWGSMWMG
jgi:hypothetical protein